MSQSIDDIISSQDSNSSSQHISSSQSSQQAEREEQIRKEKEHHRALFQKALNETESEVESEETETEAAAQKKKGHSTSLIVDNAKKAIIFSYLKGTVSKPNPQFKYQVEEMRFSIQEDSKGNELLYRTKKPRETKNKKVNLNEATLPVAIKEDFFDIIYQIHSVQQGHPGKLFNFSNYYYYYLFII